MKKNKAYRLKDNVALLLGLELNNGKRYRLKQEHIEKLNQITEEQEPFSFKSETKTNQYNEPKFALSALKQDGKIMPIDEWCEFYGIPKEQAKSYKLVTHSGKGAYYNLASSNLEAEQDVIDVLELFSNAVNKYADREPVKIEYKGKGNGEILQIIFSDTHIGMNPDEKGVSLYGGKWSKEDLFERANVIIREINGLIFNNISCVQVINLGDYADGLDGFTVRRGHSLPQNMSNEEVFDNGVKFMTYLYDSIRDKFKGDMIWYNVCNSNHSSSFDYFISEAFRGLVSRVDDKIHVINEKKFIGHFTYGKHTEIITHGKDDVSLKFGFKYNLDPKGKEKISEYINFYKLDRTDNYLHFHKGDSHVYAQDKSENYDFNSYLALSPSSSWVQANFKSGRSGFTFILKDVNSYLSSRIDYEFSWGNNNLK